jgi:hypothetical protein
MLDLFELLLRQREHLFAHQRAHRDLNPLRARPLVSNHVAAWRRFPLTHVESVGVNSHTQTNAAWTPITW